MLVLCASWLNLARLDKVQYDLVELFAGEAEISSAFRGASKAAASLDISYDKATSRKGAMDLTTSSGLVLSRCIQYLPFS